MLVREVIPSYNNASTLGGIRPSVVRCESNGEYADNTRPDLR